MTNAPESGAAPAAGDGPAPPACGCAHARRVSAAANRNDGLTADAGFFTDSASRGGTLRNRRVVARIPDASEYNASAVERALRLLT